MIKIMELTPVAFEPYGHVLGKPFPMAPATDSPAFHNAATDFRREHLFDVEAGGPHGRPELLWVNYRSAEPGIETLEMHRLTEQALIPLTGSIIQIVAVGRENGEPDIATLAAFHVPVGKGICMQPGCWHTTRVESGEVTCAMLTRASTTADLVDHLVHGSKLRESAICRIDARHVDKNY